jgi:TctA family transporter
LRIAGNAAVGAAAKVATDFTLDFMKSPGTLRERVAAAHAQMDYGKSLKYGAIVGASNGALPGVGGIAASTTLSYRQSRSAGASQVEAAEDAGLSGLAATSGALAAEAVKAKAAQEGAALATSADPTGVLSTVSIIVVGGAVKAGIESLGRDVPEILEPTPADEPDHSQ